jgi:hypothetical protein
VHKLYAGSNALWRSWLLNDLVCDIGDGLPGDSFLRRIISSKLQRFRALTRIDVRDGRVTSFWFDDWLSSGPLCLHFPALFTHVVRPHYSVASALSPLLKPPS